MEQIINYVKPELLVVAIVLYFVGVALKKAEAVSDKYIPVILGIISIAICALWVFANGVDNIAMALFTSIVQGVLVAGLSTYVNQIIKQFGKED